MYSNMDGPNMIPIFSYFRLTEKWMITLDSSDEAPGWSATLVTTISSYLIKKWFQTVNADSKNFILIKIDYFKRVHVWNELVFYDSKFKN